MRLESMVNISSEQVETTITQLILNRLHLDGNGSGKISIDTPLLGNGLGLDSLEALAIAMEIEAEFGIFIDDDALTVELFESIGSLAEYVKGQLR